MTGKALLGQVSDIDIRLLRVFGAVVRCGGLTAAELELNIGRSTISRHLKDLETRLGVTLCHRGRGGFVLTGEGEQVHEASLHLLAAIDAFRRNVDDIHRRMTGQISVALFDKAVTNSEAQVPEAFRLFDELAPEVRLDVYVEPTNTIEGGVIGGRFQIGIIPTHRESKSLDYRHLYREQMYLYCGHRHLLFPLADADVRRADVHACKYAGIGYHSPNMGASHRLELRRSADVHDQEALAALILSGRYVGFLPDHYARIFVERGLMRPLLSDVFQYRCDFASIVRASPKPSRLVATFLECLTQAHRSAT